MRAGWKTITLNDACIQMNGIWKGTKEPLVPAKVLRTTNFSKDCRIKLDDLAIIDVEKKKLDARRLQRGDIIVEKSGGGPKQPVGRVILFDMDDDDYSVCNFTSALRIKDKEQLDYNYLHKYLTYLYFDGETEKYQSNLVGLRNLDFKGYVGIEVPYPSLNEQQRIVDILDREFAKIDALKANAEKSLQAAKDLFQATLKKELEPKEGWKRYCLQDVCTDYGDYGMSLPSKSFDGVRYLRITDITEWGDLNDDKVSVDADEIDERYMVRAGDILFARTGATVGKTLVYEERFGRCCYAGYLIRYRPDQSIVLPRMLYYITHSASYYEWVAISQKSATLPNISAKLYNSYELSLPSTKEQGRIISELDELNEKCLVLQQNYQKTLALCDDLKQSLLRKAFNGEL